MVPCARTGVYTIVTCNMGSDIYHMGGGDCGGGIPLTSRKYVYYCQWWVQLTSDKNRNLHTRHMHLGK